MLDFCLSYVRIWHNLVYHTPEHFLSPEDGLWHLWREKARYTWKFMWLRRWGRPGWYRSINLLYAAVIGRYGRTKHTWHYRGYADIHLPLWCHNPIEQRSLEHTPELCVSFARIQLFVYYYPYFLSPFTFILHIIQFASGSAVLTYSLR